MAEESGALVPAGNDSHADALLVVVTAIVLTARSREVEWGLFRTT